MHLSRFTIARYARLSVSSGPVTPLRLPPLEFL